MGALTSEGGEGYEVNTTVTTGMTTGLTIDVDHDDNDADAVAWTASALGTRASALGTRASALGTRARVSSPSPAIAFVYDLERQEEDCPFQLIDLQVTHTHTRPHINTHTHTSTHQHKPVFQLPLLFPHFSSPHFL